MDQGSDRSGNIMMHQNILMTRAFNNEGEIVSIDKVERGRACQCTCIVCSSGLIARQGSEKKA